MIETLDGIGGVEAIGSSFLSQYSCITHTPFYYSNYVECISDQCSLITGSIFYCRDSMDFEYVQVIITVRVVVLAAHHCTVVDAHFVIYICLLYS